MRTVNRFQSYYNNNIVTSYILRINERYEREKKKDRWNRSGALKNIQDCNNKKNRHKHYQKIIRGNHLPLSATSLGGKKEEEKKQSLEFWYFSCSTV